MTRSCGRESASHGADIVLVCFQVTELKEEAQVLVNELRVFTTDISKDKLVLVGTKSAQHMSCAGANMVYCPG